MVPYLIYIWEWSIHYGSLSDMFTLLHSSMNQELFKKYVCNQSSHYEKYGWCCVPQLLSETEVLSNALLYQLCLTRYTAVWIKDSLNSSSVIKVATMKIQIMADIFPLHKGSHDVQPPNQYFSLSANMNGTQRRTLVSHWGTHCTYCKRHFSG